MDNQTGVHWSDQVNITKVSIGAKKVTVHYANEKKGESYKFTCKDPVHPDLWSSLQLLTGHVQKSCEFPKSYVEKVKVRSITLSHVNQGEEQVLHIKLKCERDLKDNDPFVFETTAMETGFPKEVDEVIKQTRAYLSGDKRAQGTLFPSKGKTEKEPVDDGLGTARKMADKQKEKAGAPA